jgi:hypothetical protein
MAKHKDLSATTFGGKLGYLAASVVGLPIFSVLLFVAFYGDCFDSEECHRGGGVRFLLVIVLTLGVTITVGLVTRKLVNAWLDERR